MTTRRSFPVPASALAVGAHPDDVEFGAGATLATWASAGCVVHHLVLTDGSKGTWNLDADLNALVAQRQDEQRAAARALGATGEVRFLDNVDGLLEANLANRLAVARTIRELRPAVVLGHDPWRRYRLHPDHRAAGWLVTDAVVDAREPHVAIDGLAAWRPDALLLWEADQPDLVIDVSAGVNAKLEALFAHRSQFESTMHINQPHINQPDTNHPESDSEMESFRRRVIDKLATWGQPHGMSAAETFRLIDDL